MHRAFKVVILFAHTSLVLLGATLTSLAENPQVNVSVYNDAQPSRDTLIRAEQRAAMIFSRAGFDVNWVNCAHVPSDHGSSACNEIDGLGHLVLRIISHVASSTSDAAFGVAFFLGSDGTGRQGDVFWQRVQALHANSSVDLAEILGSVMAHEMGHLLLGSKAHAISGIMRAHWESSELHRIGMGTLLFLARAGKANVRQNGRVQSAANLEQRGAGLLSCSFSRLRFSAAPRTVMHIQTQKLVGRSLRHKVLDRLSAMRKLGLRDTGPRILEEKT